MREFVLGFGWALCICERWGEVGWIIYVVTKQATQIMSTTFFVTFLFAGLRNIFSPPYKVQYTQRQIKELLSMINAGNQSTRSKSYDNTSKGLHRSISAYGVLGTKGTAQVDIIA